MSAAVRFSLPCLSPGCFVNAKCGAGLLPFLLVRDNAHAQSCPDTTVIGVVGESWGLMVCLQPITSIWIDLLLPKLYVLSVSLSEHY